MSRKKKSKGKVDVYTPAGRSKNKPTKFERFLKDMDDGNLASSSKTVHKQRKRRASCALATPYKKTSNKYVRNTDALIAIKGIH